MIFGTIIGTLETLQNREDKNWDMEKIKKDVICLLDRMIVKQQEKA